MVGKNREKEGRKSIFEIAYKIILIKMTMCLNFSYKNLKPAKRVFKNLMTFSAKLKEHNWEASNVLLQVKN